MENWPKLLPAIQFSLNSIISESTQQTPFKLFLGREPRMLLDLMLPYPLPDKDAPSMIKRTKEEIWRVRDAVADQQKRNFIKIQKQYVNPPAIVFVYHATHEKKCFADRTSCKRTLLLQLRTQGPRAAHDRLPGRTGAPGNHARTGNRAHHLARCCLLVAAVFVVVIIIRTRNTSSSRRRREAIVQWCGSNLHTLPLPSCAPATTRPGSAQARFAPGERKQARSTTRAGPGGPPPCCAVVHGFPCILDTRNKVWQCKRL